MKRRKKRPPSMLLAGPTVGPTGRFPDGKAAPDDRGELAFRVGADVERKLVRLEFGTPVTWLAWSPDEAEEIGRGLIRKAAEARGS